MAKPPGRKPTPTHLKLLRGTPGKRRLNHNEPRPETAIPKFPQHLNETAKKEWTRISKHLASLGLLSEIDRAALAAFCVAWARWAEAEEKLKAHGILVKSKSPNGFPVQSPYLAIANKAMKQMVDLATEFGMTPSSRSRTRAQKDPDDDEFLPKPRPV